MVNIKKINNLSDYQQTIVLNYLSIVCNTLNGFILFPLILNNLGIQALSVFGIFFSIKSFIDIGVGWFSSSITKNILKYNNLKYNIFTLSFMVNFIYGIIGFFIFLFYAHSLESDFLISIYYFGVFVFISFIIMPFYEIIIGSMQQSVVAFFKFLQQFLFLVLSITIFTSKEDKSLDIIFMGLLISSLITFVLAFIYCYKKYNIVFSIKRLNKKIVYKIIFFDGIDIFVNAILIISLLQLDVILINYLYGHESSSVYLILWKIPNTIIMLGWRVSEPFQAVVVSQIKKDKFIALEKFKKFEKKIILLGIAFGMMYLLFGGHVLKIWIGFQNVPNVNFMYIAPSILISMSVIQRLYLSANFYTKGLDKINLLMFFELLIKVFFTCFMFKEFKEVSPIIGWMFGLLLTIYFYRVNAYRVFK